MAVTARRTSVTSVVPGRMPCVLHLPESRRCRSYRPTSRVGQEQSSTTATARHHCRSVVRPPKHDVPEKPSDLGNPDFRRSPSFSPAAALRRHRDRSQDARTPQRYSYLRPGLSSTDFEALTEGSVTSIYGSPASKLVRCHGRRIHRVFDVSVNGFPEQGRQVLLPRRSSRMFAYTTFAVADPKECHVNWSTHDGE